MDKMREVKHIGIILDGNRRFSKKIMEMPWKGHEYGAKKISKLLEWVSELGVKKLTLYAFSVQNFHRPKKEFDYLMKLFRKEFTSLIDERLEELNKKGIRINVIGRISLFPEDIQERMRKIMELTKNNKKYAINFAMGYGGREEIIDAVKKLGRELESGKLKADDINEDMFKDYLYMEDEPDFIIRTGGEIRTSNFLLWQSHYSEWFFLEKMWPEFEKEDLVKCFNAFKNRSRRFGK
jgi:undecaprenyl diphosphate synthase